MRGCAVKAGFTMIEMVAVLAIMAICLALVAPQLRNWNQGVSLTNAAEQLIDAANFARSQAIVTADTHRLEFDLTSGAYHVSRIQDGATVRSAGEFAQDTQLPTSFKLDLRAGGAGASSVEFYANGRTTPATLRVTTTGGDWIEVGCESAAERFHVLAKR